MAFDRAQLLTDVEDRITLTSSVISRYLADLNADALAPFKSYSLNGETTTQNEWRAGIAKIVSDLQKTLEADIALRNRLRPYEVRTRWIL